HSPSIGSSTASNSTPSWFASTSDVLSEGNNLWQRPNRLWPSRLNPMNICEIAPLRAAHGNYPASLAGWGTWPRHRITVSDQYGADGEEKDGYGTGGDQTAGGSGQSRPVRCRIGNRGHLGSGARQYACAFPI